MSDSSPRAVACDPQWLPHTYDASGTELTSVFVRRDQLNDVTFLSDDHYQGNFPKIAHSTDDIAVHASDAQQAPIHFIFHTSFCGSTLLAKALDIPGRTVGLREPDVLINLANRIARSDDDANRQRLRLVLRLLARPFGPGETVIVKPSNFANRLILPSLEALPDARAVLLHSDLPTLLRSLVKKGIWGRIFGRKLLRSAGAWTSINFGFDAGQTFELTDLQIAGLSWLMQIHHFGEVARRMGDRVLIVDSADFMADPAATIGRAAALFGIELDQTAAAAIAKGPVFSRHSKFSQRDYSVDAREAEHDAVVAAHGEGIAIVVRWVEAVAVHCGIPLIPATTA